MNTYKRHRFPSILFSRYLATPSNYSSRSDIEVFSKLDFRPSYTAPSKPRKPRLFGSLPIYFFFNITLEQFEYLSR